MFHKKILHHNHRCAVTLVELLIYLAIVGTLITVTSIFAIENYSSYQKNIAIQNLQADARFVLNRIEQEINSASSINTVNSTFDDDNGVLELTTSDAQTNPTIIALQNNQITLTQGAGAGTTLLSGTIIATQLRFENLTADKTPGTIKTTMTLAFSNPGNHPQLETSITISSTSNIKKSL